MKVKVVEASNLTDKDLDSVLEKNLKRLIKYKAKGYTALQLINNKIFPKIFIEKYFNQI
jgi:hypothetical protein